MCGDAGVGTRGVAEPQTKQGLAGQVIEVAAGVEAAVMVPMASLPLTM